MTIFYLATSSEYYFKGGKHWPIVAMAIRVHIFGAIEFFIALNLVKALNIK